MQTSEAKHMARIKFEDSHVVVITNDAGSDLSLSGVFGHPEIAVFSPDGTCAMSSSLASAEDLLQLLAAHLGYTVTAA